LKSPISAAIALSWATAALAQPLDLSRGGPIDITASDGVDWKQSDRVVTARGNAKATRGDVTVTADRLMAWYRRKGGDPRGAAPEPAGETSTEGNEIYRVQAEGHVTIYTASDRALATKAVFDLDQAVLVMTGDNLTLTTPQSVLTARDDMEYWPNKHMAVARGDAVLLTNDARRIAADTLVAYTIENPQPAAPVPARGKATDDPLAASSKLQRLEAYGHVSIRTPTDTVTGDKAIYVPDIDKARLAGGVRITRGQNQLNGEEADVNLKTGVATLVGRKSGRVQGLVVPDDQTNKGLVGGTAPAPEKGR
jgi:lipopolysaccharide export system protein LptA